MRTEHVKAGAVTAAGGANWWYRSLVLRPCLLPPPAALRPVGAGDLPGLARLVRQAFADAAEDGAAGPLRRKVRRLYYGSYGPLVGPASWWLAGADGAPVAVVLAVDGPQDPLPTVALIAVAPACRRQGLGSCLVMQALAGLFAAGYRRCRARVRQDNVASRRLFAYCGFGQGETID